MTAGSVEYLPIINIPIDLPIYRMNNGRTRSIQEERIDSEDLPNDYFTRGSENEEAQNKQHEILAELANVEVDGTTANIIDHLREVGQTEPILISPSGVVLNGNRRLAAMREIYEENRNEYKNFESVKAAVLRPMSEVEEMVYETRLQMQVEVKLDYSWVNEAMQIEKLQDLGKSYEEIGAYMNQKAADVKNRYQALLEGKRYLSEWLRKPHAYGELEKTEQIFKELPKKLKGKSEAHKEAARKLQWCLMSGQEALPGRIYEISLKTLSRVSEIVDRANFQASVDTSNAEDLLDFDEREEDLKFLAFSRSLDNSDAGKVNRDVVVGIAIDVYREDRDDRTAREPLVDISKANSLLESVIIEQASLQTLDQIEGQLKSIEIRTKNLIRLLQDRIKSQK